VNLNGLIFTKILAATPNATEPLHLPIRLIVIKK